MRKCLLILVVLMSGCLVGSRMEPPVVPGYKVVGFRKPQLNELIWKGGDWISPARDVETNGEMWVVVPK